MSELTIEVHERPGRGKSANRKLRAAGKIPAVVYGGGREPKSIEIDAHVLHELLRKSGSEHAVFLLKLGDTGKSRHTMIRDLSVDPVSRRILHVDFQRVNLKEKVRVSIPIELVGTPTGVKNEGGVLDFITREVEIESLPGQIPAHLELDVTALHVGQHLEAGDLTLPEGVTLLDDVDKVLVSVAHARVMEEAAAEGEELLEEELEEPEVIGRGKAAAAEEDEERD
ncbi:MAG: 50S ribosomal protein L25 [Thermoanaerobaculia bacterium]